MAYRDEASTERAARCKRGDVVALEQRERIHYVHGSRPSSEHVTLSLARVTSCSREGVAKRVLRGSTEWKVENLFRTRVLVIAPERQEQAARVLAASEPYATWDSVDALRAAILGA